MSFHIYLEEANHQTPLTQWEKTGYEITSPLGCVRLRRGLHMDHGNVIMIHAIRKRDGNEKKIALLTGSALDVADAIRALASGVELPPPK